MEKISNNDKSQVLIDALPYIQKYNNKILVIKYGGNAMTNMELRAGDLNVWKEKGR
ncbi:hypothetical protein [Ruminococcus flavefaciens]|uniref:hypothetical protein n=1 Tax=Ruminococcus flavefaciens TaxID=1265 RepID=UPI0034E93CAC